MLGAYSEHLKKLREQYGDSESTSAVAPPASYRFSLNSRERSPRRHPSPEKLVQRQGGRTFEEEKSELLQLLQQHDGTASDAPMHTTGKSTRDHQGATGMTMNTPSASSSSASNQARYREILGEVEQLSATVTAMHKERTTIESQWSQRLREARRELEQKEARVQELEVHNDQLHHEQNDLRTQLASLKKEALKSQRECEMFRQQVLLQTEQQQQLAQLMRDSEEREKLIVAQEQCMKELEVRCDSATAAAKEYEQRFLRLQRSHDLEVDGSSHRESQWREMVSTIAGALLVMAREVEEGCLRLHHVDRVLESHEEGRMSSPSPFRSSSAQSTSSSGTSIAEKNLEQALDLLETNMGNGDNPAGFKRARDAFAEAVQRQLRRFTKAVAATVAHSDEQRSHSAKSVSETHRLEELIGRAEAQAAAATRDNTQLRREKHDLLAHCEAQKQEIHELKQRLSEVIADIEKREESHQMHNDSLRQLIEGADLDLHRYRLRVNELEAINTRVLAQRSLSEEESKATIQQLRQSVAMKDGQVSRLRAEIDQLRTRLLLADTSNRSADDDDQTNHRSVSALHDLQSSAAGSVVGTGFLKQQNQQLAAHIDALQKRLDRMKEEKESAVSALEQQREVIRQHEDVLELVAKSGHQSSRFGAAHNSSVMSPPPMQ